MIGKDFGRQPPRPPLDSRRLNALLAATERLLRGRPGGSLARADGPAGALDYAGPARHGYYALVESPGLPVRVGTTLGLGTVTMYVRDGADLVAGPTGVDCYNLLSDPVPTDALVIIAWVDGAWACIAGDCSA